MNADNNTTNARNTDPIWECTCISHINGEEFIQHEYGYDYSSYSIYDFIHLILKQFQNCIISDSAHVLLYDLIISLRETLSSHEVCDLISYLNFIDTPEGDD